MNDKTKELNDILDDQIARFRRQGRIITAIKRGRDRVKHHQRYTQRVVDAIKAAIIEEFPAASESIVCTSSGYGDNALRVWGVDGITYDQSISLSWSNWQYYANGSDRTSLPWADGLLKQLERHDSEKSISSLERFRKSIPHFVELERLAVELQGEIRKVSGDLPYACQNALPLFSKLS